MLLLARVKLPISVCRIGSSNFLEYFKVFLVGGAICVIGQLLIDYTRLTPARILTAFVVAGVILGAIGIYGPLADWAGAGATVPLTGFGWNLAKGVKKAIAGFLISLIGKPKDKNG